MRQRGEERTRGDGCPGCPEMRGTNRPLESSGLTRGAWASGERRGEASLATSGSPSFLRTGKLPHSQIAWR